MATPSNRLHYTHLVTVFLLQHHLTESPGPNWPYHLPIFPFDSAGDTFSWIRDGLLLDGVCWCNKGFNFEMVDELRIQYHRISANSIAVMRTTNETTVKVDSKFEISMRLCEAGWKWHGSYSHRDDKLGDDLMPKCALDTYEALFFQLQFTSNMSRFITHDTFSLARFRTFRLRRQKWRIRR